jgi:guanylate kinase
MNKVILIGKAASGKDHMRKVLEGRGFNYGTSYTTRPPRNGEIDGEDYFFLSDEDFAKMDDEDQWYEYVQFNGWMYGTTKKQFLENCNLFIMTPIGISFIDPVDRKNCTIIYLDIPSDIRLSRLYDRDDSEDKIERRMKADEKDFENFTNYDIVINNPNF